MATNTIITCDACKKEIRPGERSIRISATRWQDVGIGYNGAQMAVAKFDMSEFCSDGCVLAAVRALLNGNV